MGYWYCLPDPLFTNPTCSVLEDSMGDLLGATIAKDGQWRFPYQSDVPEKFKAAIVEFEDHRFYSHWGVDPIGIGRAIVQNIKNKSVVSGASTLSMQVIRMSRGSKKRNLWNKIIETILATRLEWSYSKDEIIALHASNAPFGGNVVGLDAAAWRYYGKQAKLMTWGEAATLAVLPNSPALIHPGRNRDALLQKRNRLLRRLNEKSIIDDLTADLAMEEPLPEKPIALPQLAPHLLDRAKVDYFKNSRKNITRLTSTIDRSLQRQLNQIIRKYHLDLRQNEIHNLAALIVEVETGNVLAYVGNEAQSGLEHGQSVDVIKAPRSTGSILKPFLMAFALQEGSVLPNSILTDIPTQIKGYRPENYNRTYDGVIPLNTALSRSLNIPFIHLLRKYGLERFHSDLNKIGLTTINKSPKHYGLTLTLGGAEGTLWDITQAYTGMSRTLNFYNRNSGTYRNNGFKSLNYNHKNSSKNIDIEDLKEPPILSASAIWHTFEAMKKVERPTSEGDWESFRSSHAIAWKTGTSFGFRDAWAVGVTPKYVVGVWVGNADGEGRPGLVGVKAAAPVLFDIFDLLPASRWFDPPYNDMEQTFICKQSGYRALDICEKDSVWIPETGLKASACTHHQTIHLDPSEQYRVHSSCENPTDMIHKNWFVLPPIEEYFHAQNNPSYQKLPPFRSDCFLADNDAQQVMQLIYPKLNTKIYVPKDLDGNLSKTVFKIAHRTPQSIVHWHIDATYVGETRHFHEMEFAPKAGEHTLTLVDEKGNRLETKFEILSR